jgi:hypothetical protein
MLELLPKSQKQSIKKEYFLRLTAISLSFLLVVGILFLIFLSPSYFLSVVKESVINREFENVKKTHSESGDKEFEDAIKSSKEMIALLKPKDGVFLMKDLILKIISKKSSGVAIDGISMNYSKDGQYQISIKGISKNRELLKMFADSLRAEKEFNSVDLPISNFAKIADIDFNITLNASI